MSTAKGADAREIWRRVNWNYGITMIALGLLFVHVSYKRYLILGLMESGRDLRPFDRAFVASISTQDAIDVHTGGWSDV
jgi:hypothetical protein